MKIANISLNSINNKNSVNFKNNQNNLLRKYQTYAFDSFELSNKKNKYKSGHPAEEYKFDRYQDKKTYVIDQNQAFTIIRESDRNTSLIELEAKSKDKTINTLFYLSNKHRDDSFCEYTIYDGNTTNKLLMQWDKKGNYIFEGSDEEAKILKNALINLRTVINSPSYERDFGRNRNVNIQIKNAIDYLSDISKIEY